MADETKEEKATKAAPKTSASKTTSTKASTSKASATKTATPKVSPKDVKVKEAPVAEETKEAPKKTTTKKVAAPKEAAPVVEDVKEEAPVVETPKAAPKKTASTKKVEPVSEVYVPRVKKQYEESVKAAMLEKYHYKSVMEIPKLNKIVINWGVGDAVQDNKRLEDAVNELTLISGQKPVVTRAKHSISSFKLREGQAIGCKVTLRGARMYEFYDKLVSIALPRVRDFRGVSKNAFDGRGNYTLGVREQLIFPEIDYDKVHKVRGMDIVIVTTAKTDEEAYTLLSLLGMPFSR